MISQVRALDLVPRPGRHGLELIGATGGRVVGPPDIAAAVQNGAGHFDPGVLAAAKRGLVYIDEATPLEETHNDYARGKIVCERLLAEAAQRQGRGDGYGCARWNC